MVAQEMMQKVLKAINIGIQKATFDIERHALRLVPVDTGRLKGSIYAKTGKNSITIGSDTEYDKFVEFGTVRMRAQPFLRPAIHMGIKKFIPKRVKAELRKIS